MYFAKISQKLSFLLRLTAGCCIFKKIYSFNNQFNVPFIKVICSKNYGGLFWNYSVAFPLLVRACVIFAHCRHVIWIMVFLRGIKIVCFL